MTTIVDEIEKDYTEEVVPPCRVCKEPLKIAECGGGRTVWNCCGVDWDKSYKDGGPIVMKPGRIFPGDEHTDRSEFIQRRLGDDRVIALLRVVRAAEAEAAARDNVDALWDARDDDSPDFSARLEKLNDDAFERNVELRAALASLHAMPVKGEK